MYAQTHAFTSNILSEKVVPSLKGLISDIGFISTAHFNFFHTPHSTNIV